ncbi:benenodin family lasso peptide [Xanthomonas hortorum]|uniref:Benenodin family lasso peptide n=1 Tax=Xanthomonas hortorum pv. hederae TaxID=453603 RepID=A0A9X4BUR7_9XANT|nr:benenodin family lasso peptide [Xanthomonas hortorum]MCE4372550.1 benenodin family lasso peptide [Xanthomonas hortorum pv. hederae]MDC8640011.1 benenodin family lasso peptide [Xanthomonas hortorum pv. hederae]
METTRKDPPCSTPPDQALILLGVASRDTQGGPLAGEEMGGTTTLGISAD